MPVTIPIIHFNDVYRVRQRTKDGGTLGADQFVRKIQDIRESWGEPASLSNLAPPPTPSDPSTPRDWSQHASSRQRKGLVLFSGDLYSPSVESSVTRGTHLVPVINAINLDCACLGNHDWDFGYPHLQTLMSQNNFPWLFSNVVDRSTCSKSSSQDKVNWDEDLLHDDAQVNGTLRYWTTTVQSVKVGCIGIVEKEWIATVPNFPEGFVYRNMVNTAMRLSKTLRDENGEACELVIAITHSRLPNDIDFANAVGATLHADPNTHGVDLVLGGHDHIYYVGNGATSFQGDAFPRREPGTENDQNAMVVKSGTDFRDLSELKLELTDRNDAAIRKRTIQSLSVKRYRTATNDPSSPQLKSLLDNLLAKISKSTSQSVAYTLTPWDVRSEKVRTDESAFGNFVADVLMNSYEEVLRERDNRGELSETRPLNAREVDCCIICGGSLRGDQVYGPGKIALSDVLEILPFEDAVVCKELKGQDIWDALENGLSMYPKQEGRFPQVAGMMVRWDSTKPPGSRLVSVELLDNPLDTPANKHPTNNDTQHASEAMDVDDEEGKQRGQDGDQEQGDVGKLRRFSVTKHPQGGYDVEVHRPALVSRGALEMHKTYRVVTREYLTEGYDGFEALKRGTFVVDHENGQLMSAIVRKFLLGASYLWRMKQIRRLQAQTNLDADSSTFSSSASGSGSGSNVGVDANVGEIKAEAGEAREGDADTLSKRTRIAITRARSLNLLKRAMKHNAVNSPVTPTTPVKSSSFRARSGSLGTSKDDADADLWRMVVDQSPGGFRDALHVGGSEHHSKFDSVSKRFNEPLTTTSSNTNAAADTSSGSATRTYDGDASAKDSGVPAAKRLRSETKVNGEAGERVEDKGIDNALFDPSLASGLLTQIKELLALVAQAADSNGALYTTSETDGISASDAEDRVQDREEEQDDDTEAGGSGGANIALGSMAVDEGDEDATLSFLTNGGAKKDNRKSKGTPTQLSQHLVKRAHELRSSFAKLKEAAKSLPGGMEMGLSEQERLLSALEGFIARQDESFAQLGIGSEEEKKLRKDEDGANSSDEEDQKEERGGAFEDKSKISSNNFKHGAVASTSFHLNAQEMQRLREDIKASTSQTQTQSSAAAAAAAVVHGSESADGKGHKVLNGDGGSWDKQANNENNATEQKKVVTTVADQQEDDLSNLAFVSPLVDGRLVDIARQIA
ncbi:related to 5`-nucleotidase precursor [Melanopsichium pennsylvanicum]|uniref:Related to 5`-nucleotidase n=2 Tax=Melanopsichium pennsylvanicum TaxID=63383 RepID=A0AAJ5C483_9BASI|nr:related to 5`-nucleotidase precursor [Melanopsichium pennsylvanicum 4]SNX83415.1 related to 5`-nucleotidase precursor [Melanopsichium pennsylvanicum]